MTETETAPPAKAPPINAENAREMQARSVESRRRNAELLKAEAELLKAAVQPQEQPCDYVALSLSRVRARLEKIDEMLAVEVDPQKIDRLAAAFARLAEVERQLDGRPLPGSRRPGKERAAATPPIVPL